MRRFGRPTAAMLIIGVLAATLPWAAVMADTGRLGRGDMAKLEPWLGTYRGSFRSAVETPWPDDDLNLNPCVPEREDCSVHKAPLADIFLVMAAPDRAPSLTFHRSRDDLDAGRPLDLLGLGCRSAVAEALGLDKAATASGGRRWTLRFRLDAGRCPVGTNLGREHELLLHLVEAPGEASRSVEIEILRGTQDLNYLYTVENGQRRRVRVVSPGNTERGDRFEGERVCVEDDNGEYPPERCTTVVKTREGYALPFPTSGGGVGVVFGTNRRTNLELKRTQGEVRPDYFTARFVPYRD